MLVVIGFKLMKVLNFVIVMLVFIGGFNLFVFFCLLGWLFIFYNMIVIS